MQEFPFREIFIAFGVLAGLAFLASLLLFLWVRKRLLALDLRPDSPLSETLRSVPFSLVLALDLLDLSLNFFSAPLVWIVLGRFKLGRLRGFATAAAAIPGTQMVPVLTVGWLIARILSRKRHA